MSVRPNDGLGSYPTALKFNGTPGLQTLASSCTLAPLPLPARGQEPRQLPEEPPPADFSLEMEGCHLPCRRR